VKAPFSNFTICFFNEILKGLLFHVRSLFAAPELLMS